MEIFNKKNSKNTGQLPALSSWMRIGAQNSAAQSISVQVSEIPIGSEQPMHNYEPEQCYCIIKGKGLMIIEDETKEVSAGHAGPIGHGERCLWLSLPLAGKINLTESVMWINIAIKRHMIEARYENHSDDT